MANLRADNLTGTGGRNAIDGSVFFDGSGRLSVPNSADVRVGSDDFTIEAWIRAENPGDWTTVLGMWDSSATRRTYALQRKKSDSKLYFYVSADGGSTIGATNTQYAYGGNVTLGEWHHVAGVRDGNTIRAYLNGVEVGNASFTASILNNTTDALFIGDTEVTAGGEAFNGYMSNVRMIKGTCLYPSGTTFTPPTEKLTVVPNTVLLCCQDSDNPTQEATGKTITGYGGLQTFDDTELVTNSGFVEDLSGWTVAQGTIAWNAGKAHMTGTSGNSLEQNVTTVVGKRYRLTATVDNTANTGANAGITFGGTLEYVSSDTITTGSKTFTIDLTATSTSTLVDLWGGTAVTGYWSNASVKLLDPPKTPKVLPPVGVDEGVVFEGDTKVNSKGYMYFPTGDTSQRGRGRGVFMANAVSPTMSNSISYIDIQSSGNTVDFGDLTVTLRYGAGGSSATRGLSGGGVTPSWPANNVIDYFTLATTGNAQEYGDLIETGSYGKACLANSTRLLWCGGYSAPDGGNTNTVSYSTIATLGDALNFGDLSDGSSLLRRYLSGGIQSPTRGILVGGYSGSSYTNTLVHISITTLGDSEDFGDLSYTAAGTPGASSSTRGVIFPGYNGSNYNTNIIEYVTIATTGDAVDFGDTAHSGGYGQAVSNSSRAVMGHGITPSPGTNYMEFVTIATTGNASDFGDMGVHTGDSGNNNNCSDSHGGLS